ncbi:molybdate ABC transporter permease subunit [Tautonia plasticadhaerens]|uniref:Molybdenum transport system permease n=1 Tax=Tautonia plasticadhaerens TaxID=2527974 RepID=A0A518H1W9_9BACT|nr:molybdate ABC transporter permease subunit [Tautonia plasticadhaerens]QDV34849.1 Molybdenum transport system permease protein ModB [Tautonia plasticadhaerens]
MVETIGPLLLSIRVAAMATAAVVALGLPAAILLARGRFPGKGILAGVLTLPLVLPPTVLGYGLLLLLGRRGPVGGVLDRVFGGVPVFHWSGLVIASAVAAFPLFLLPARGAIESVDPALEDAARLLGRRERDVLLRVTLPLAWRGLLAGALLAFARALGDFGASLMVAGDIPGRTRTAAMAIYDAVEAGRPAAAALLSLLISAVAVAVLVAVQGVGGGAGRARGGANG